MERLAELEQAIEDDLLDVGLALAEIKTEKLYKPRTWETYCKERWGWTRKWCEIRIKAAQALASQTGTQVPVSGRRTIRELAGEPKGDKSQPVTSGLGISEYTDVLLRLVGWDEDDFAQEVGSDNAELERLFDLAIDKIASLKARLTDYQEVQA